ncbi:hypothetical protein D3Z38_14165 [Clostridiales bacterium]|nr:hypothetical protein [Clostridiales bacterium]
MERMKAVVKQRDGKEGWAYTEVERRAPKPDEVEIRVKCIGICGSELHLYHDNHFYTPPVVVGHEFCGEISRVGKNVTDWKVGERVVAQLDKGACGTCEFCRKGMANFCPNGKAVGYDENGGWAEYYCTPEKFLFKLADQVTDEEGAMAEPLNVVCQAEYVKEVLRPQDIVMVQGCGTIGLMAAMAAKVLGAAKVLVTGTDVDEAVRLPIARSINAIDLVVNVEKENIREIIAQETNGRGADVIIEASGAGPAIAMMPQLIKKTGTIVVLGETAAEEIKLNWNQFLLKACKIIFSFGEVYDAWDMAVKLLASKKLELEKLITHKLPLSQYKKGFELLEAKKGLKVLLYPEHQ